VLGWSGHVDRRLAPEWKWVRAQWMMRESRCPRKRSRLAEVLDTKLLVPCALTVQPCGCSQLRPRGPSVPCHPGPRRTRNGRQNCNRRNLLPWREDKARTCIRPCHWRARFCFCHAQRRRSQHYRQMYACCVFSSCWPRLSIRWSHTSLLLGSGRVTPHMHLSPPSWSRHWVCTS
jgi:hypothetical protein